MDSQATGGRGRAGDADMPAITSIRVIDAISAGGRSANSLSLRHGQAAVLLGFVAPTNECAARAIDCALSIPSAFTTRACSATAAAV
jgi:hypothetical protein